MARAVMGHDLLNIGEYPKDFEWIPELAPKFQTSEIQIFDCKDLHHGGAPRELPDRSDLVELAWGEILASFDELTKTETPLPSPEAPEETDTAPASSGTPSATTLRLVSALAALTQRVEQPDIQRAFLYATGEEADDEDDGDDESEKCGAEGKEAVDPTTLTV